MTGQTTHPAEKLSLEDWKILSSATDQLEKAWHTSAGEDQPSLRQCLPDIADPALRQRVLMELVKIDLDFRWQRGQEQRIEDYLSEWPDLAGEDNCLRELLDTECLSRATWDRLPSPAELRSRFPEIGASIDLGAIETQADLESRPLNQVVPQLPPIPQTLGRYKVRERLGGGGMGEVYLAYDEKLNREVAIKIPKLDFQKKPDTAARFLQEAKAAASIQHDNVCPIYDVSSENDQPFLVMKRISGQSLDERLTQGPLLPNEAVGIVTPLAEALDTFHQQGLIHRDIKPSNVMLTSDGRPVLMDFGLAQEVEEATGTTLPKSLRGTPAYIAPELLNNPTISPDARSDVYSLGVLLYHLLAGQPPFHGQLTEVLRRIAEDEPPPLNTFRPHIDPNLARICQRAMAKSPAKRVQSAGDLALVLELWSKTTKRSPWLPWVATACAVGFLMSLAALVWVIKTRPNEEPNELSPKRMTQLDSDSSGEPNRGNRADEPSERQVAGAAVPKPGKSEPGGDFELAWVLPLSEENIGFFADKIDPENDSDMYLIESRRDGRLEFLVQADSEFEMVVTLFDAEEDKDTNGKPDGVDQSETFPGHPYCQLTRQVTKGHRLYLRVASQIFKSRGNYEIRVQPIPDGKLKRPGPKVRQDSIPGPPIDLTTLEELEKTFQADNPATWEPSRVEKLRQRLVAICRKHHGRPELSQIGQWLAQLPSPPMPDSHLQWLDLTQQSSPALKGTLSKIPNDGTLVIRAQSQKDHIRRLHIIEGYQPGTLAIQQIPLSENTGGFWSIFWGQGSDTHGSIKGPCYRTYDVFASAPYNTVNLRVEVSKRKQQAVGEYLLILWQSERVEQQTRESTNQD